MTDATPGDENEVYDVLGVGFGPSNLGLAIALEEPNAAATPGDRVTARFVERQERFGWHRGMLLEDTTMQVSFLKDLVTLRDPTSSFTFCPTSRHASAWSTSSTTAATSRRGSSSTTTWSGRPPGSPTVSTTAPRSSRSSPSGGTGPSCGYMTWGRRTVEAILDAGHQVPLIVTHPDSDNP